MSVQEMEASRENEKKVSCWGDGTEVSQPTAGGGQGENVLPGIEANGELPPSPVTVMGSNLKGWMRSWEMFIQEDHGSVSPKSTREHCCGPGVRTSPHHHSEPTQRHFWLPQLLGGGLRGFSSRLVRFVPSLIHQEPPAQPWEDPAPGT